MATAPESSLSSRERLKELLEIRCGHLLPLHPSQRKMWVFEQLFPGRDDFNVCFCVDLQGALDEAQAFAYFEQLCQRHRLLGARLKMRQGQPWLRLEVEPSRMFGYHPQSLHWTDQQLDEHLQALCRHPLSLQDEVLTQVDWFCRPSGGCLVWRVHHALIDAWSLSILVSDWITLASGRPLGPNPVSYLEYIHWCEQHLQTSAGQASQAYWASRVEQVERQTHRLALPRGSDCGTLPLRLSEAISEAVRQLALRLQTTPSCLLMAAYVASLAQVFEGSSLALCVPAAGRSQTRFEQTVGAFLSPLLLLIPCQRHPQPAALVGLLAKHLKEAIEHQDVAWFCGAEKPQAEALFAFQSSPTLRLAKNSPASLVPNWRPLYQGSAGLPLGLYLHDFACFHGCFRYEGLQRGAVEALAKQFETCLQSWLYCEASPTQLLTLAEERGASSGPLFPVRPKNASIPLSRAQRRVWFLEKLDPGLPLFLLASAMWIRGHLDAAHLRDCLERLVQRHEALRLRIVEEGEEAYQVVQPWNPRELDFRQLDLRHFEASERRQEALRRAHQELDRTFDLEAGPLVRWTLIQLEERLHLLVQVAHHLVVDGWSNALLVQEFLTLYRATSELGPVSAQFPDFALWQRSQQTPEVVREYWEQVLAEAPTRHELPTDRPRAAVASLRSSRLEHDLDRARLDRFERFCQQQGVTAYSFWLLGFSELCLRLSQSQEVLLGCPSSGRSHPQLERLVGFLVNTLPLRVGRAGQTSVAQRLLDLQQLVAQAQEHESMAFEEMVDWLQLDRRLDANPLLQLMLVVHPRRPPVTLPGLITQPVSLDSGYHEFDLTLTFHPKEEGGTLVWQFARDLFDLSTIELWNRYLLRILDEACHHPQGPVQGLPWLSDAELEWLHQRGQGPILELPDPPDLAAWIEERLNRLDPNGTALLNENDEWSLARLRAQVSRLAANLQSGGLKPGETVVYLGPRSFFSVVATLAIWKAGGCYCPLDPTQAPHQSQALLQDAAPQWIVVHESLKDQSVGSFPVIWGPGPPNQELPKSVTNPAAVVRLYTSGSTGPPKAVLGTAKGLINRVLWMEQYFPWEPSEAVVHKTRLTFVDSLWEVLGPLLAGVPLSVAPASIADRPDRLAQWIDAFQVTRLVLVPSLLAEMLRESLSVAACRGLKMVVSSGEALSPEIVELFYGQLPQARLLNLYGSTEVSGDVAFYEVPGQGTADGPPPIGRPLSNTRLQVLDENEQLLPAGVCGQLWVEGAAVAQGYSDRDFCGRFPSGDLARWNARGELEWLGRRDQQLKIRGIRIEPGAIEARVRQHPQVIEAVVVAFGEPGQDLRIACFYQPLAGTWVDSDTLRHFLQESRSWVYQPEVLHAMLELPRNRHGKVDRQRLRATLSDYSQRAPYRAPTGALEKLVSLVWEGVLQAKEPLGRDDNFFRLGGHSLLATVALFRLEQLLQIKLPLRELFTHPSVEGLAGRLLEIEADLEARAQEALNALPQ